MLKTSDWSTAERLIAAHREIDMQLREIETGKHRYTERCYDCNAPRVRCFQVGEFTIWQDLHKAAFDAVLTALVERRVEIVNQLHELGVEIDDYTPVMMVDETRPGDVDNRNPATGCAI